ncbi:pantoate--beta-alanine ligase [Actinotalea sp. Marseille-Q4924]|uniref:pantoate--beta-alanine ligase n=1 Tax=Actinotalea sp. Marseille-Q4924 TaxID=2866571 RepID=UPI001CE41424|nr:pantoate--beta-alanine ligase [Actinotalea sp. Marseille-Q4924]
MNDSAAPAAPPVPTGPPGAAPSAPVPGAAPTAPLLVRTRAELGAVLGAPGEGRRRAVVMTMGALHEGHLALVRLARAHADEVVVTIFVNPLQFGPAEDLARYPRDLDRDVTLLAAEGVDVVFAPDVHEVYPDGGPVVRVSAGPLGDRLEGAHRPGHFDGVLTVVLKLLHLVRPDVAVFGQKDAQQIMAVRRMVRDLDVPVEVLAGPTVRDPDGLALSSRNAYLGPAERESALALSRSLRDAQRAVADAGAGPDAVLAAARRVLDGEPGVVVDYLALVDPVDAHDVPATHRGEAVLVLAARVGSTRLIDNAVLRLGEDRISGQDGTGQ